MVGETQRGYANLCRLLTHAHLDHERGEPRVEPEVLARYTEGLIALSGCRKGEVPSLVAQGRYREAEEAARRYLQWFGAGSFFIELQDNLVYGDARRNRALADLAEHLGPSTGSGQALGTVVTGNVHYHARERHRLPVAALGDKRRHLAAPAAGEGDEPLGVLGEGFRLDAGPAALVVQMGVGEEAAEVGVAPLALAEEGQVVAVSQRDLGAGDGAQPPGAGRLRELHRPVEAVVVRESEGLVPQLPRPQHQLLDVRCAIQE